MISLLCVLVSMLAIATSTLIYWEIPIGPTTLSIPMMFLFPLAAMLLVRKDGLGIAMRTLSDFSPFWIGNAVYLAIMLFHSVSDPAATSPAYFLSRVWALAIGFLLVCHLGQISSVRVWNKLMLRTAIAGLFFFVVAFILKGRSVGISIPQELTSFFSGSMVRWQRVTMLTLNGTIDGESLADDAVVFKNPISIGLALFTLFAAANYFSMKQLLSRSLALACGLATGFCVVLMLSKLAMAGLVLGGLVLACIWLQVFASRTALLIATLSLGAISALVLIVFLGDIGAVSEKFTDAKSYQTRLEQFSDAAVILRDPRVLLMGIGPQFVFDGRRLHNLFAGSIVEGGVAAFLGAAVQFLFPFYLMLKWFPSHVRMSAQYRILIGLAWSLIVIVSLRSMVAGAGGYHDVNAIVALSVALAIFVQVPIMAIDESNSAWADCVQDTRPDDDSIWDDQSSIGHPSRHETASG